MDHNTVITAICTEFELPLDKLKGAGKGGRVSRARELACVLLPSDKIDDDELAELLGLHYTAILKLRRRAEKRMKSDRKFRDTVKRLRNGQAS